jgi:hypothetical protein
MVANKKCRVNRERTAILFSVVILLVACDSFVEKSKPVTEGMINGKVLSWRDDICYMIDIGTVYKPEPETAIFIGAIASTFENRKEWVVEADLMDFEFVRGIGKDPFPTWPEDILKKAIEQARNAPSVPGMGEHPFAPLTKQQRTDYVFSYSFPKEERFVSAVKYWAKRRYEENMQ